MKPILLVERSSRKRLCAIQDPFGKQFRRLHDLHKPGEIYRAILIHDKHPDRSLSEDRSMLSFRIVADANVDEITELIAKEFPNKGYVLSAGHWYEVHGD